MGWLRLRVSILRALVADAQGDSRLALGSLAAALAEAEPENVIRPFLDEGERMTVLLTDLSPAAGVSPTFLATLLAAFPSDAPRPHRTGSSSR